MLTALFEAARVHGTTIQVQAQPAGEQPVWAGAMTAADVERVPSPGLRLDTTHRSLNCEPDPGEPGRDLEGTGSRAFAVTITAQLSSNGPW